MLEQELPREIRDCMESGEYARYVDRARQVLAPLDLGEGLDRIFEEVNRDPLLFDALASRWIARVVDERGLDLYTSYWVGIRFRECRDRFSERAGQDALRLLLETYPA